MESLQEKLMMVVHVLRGHCPLFADFTEVVELQKEAWNLDFPSEKKERIIVHDNTVSKNTKRSRFSMSHVFKVLWRMCGQRCHWHQLCSWITILNCGWCY